MFKEQLHTSFDSIKPSPELLDRISAMMSEEASKKKPPIRMNVVKYGGIAAALCVAAGGTLLFMQSRGNDMNVSNSASMNKEDAVYDEASMAPAAAADKVADAEEAAPETISVYDTETAGADAADDAADADAMITPSNVARQEDGGYEIRGFVDDEYFITPSEASESASEAEYDDADDAAEYDGGDAVSFIESIDSGYDYSTDSLDDGANGSMTIRADDAAGEASENPMTGIHSITADIAIPEPFGAAKDNTGGDGHDDFWFPCIDHVLYCIPVDLMRLCDEEKVLAWQNDWSRQPWRSDSHAVDGIENYQNLYTFIKDMGLTREQVYEGMKKYLESTDPRTKVTEEQLETILSGDVEAITKMFASEYAIVKDDKAYSPHWLYTHYIADYEAAGITPSDISAKYELYKKLGLSDEAWEWFGGRLTRYIDGSRDEDAAPMPAVDIANGWQSSYEDTERDAAGTSVTVYRPENDTLVNLRGEKRAAVLAATEEIIGGAIKPANVTTDHNSPDDYTIQISYHPEPDKAWTWYDVGILMWVDHGYLELTKDGKITVYILTEKYLDAFSL